jgi:predicted DNA-binding protein with PD1-like motif
MDVRLLSDTDQLRTFAVVFSAGDEVSAGLLTFARRERISGASFTAIGALQRVTVGFFDLDRHDYRPIEIHEQVEVLAMTGNVALTSDGPKVHAHLVVGRSDGTAYGGHLLEAIVRPTLEVIVTETPARLRRRFDPATRLALIDLDR